MEILTFCQNADTFNINIYIAMINKCNVPHLIWHFECQRGGLGAKIISAFWRWTWQRWTCDAFELNLPTRNYFYIFIHINIATHTNIHILYICVVCLHWVKSALRNKFSKFYIIYSFLYNLYAFCVYESFRTQNHNNILNDSNNTSIMAIEFVVNPLNYRSKSSFSCC